MKDGTAGSRPNQSFYAVLGLLSLGAMSGYELRKLSEYSIQHFWRESFGQIYPSLRLLEAKGLATRRTEPGQERGRPDRQIYSITEAGREALAEWLKVDARPEVPRNELLLKMFFGAKASRETNLQHLERNRRLHEELLAVYRKTVQELREQSAGHPDLPYWLLTASYGKRISEAEIAWCDEAMAVLRELEQRDDGGSREQA
jgi:DNA-binding PadR family transcriptional regulator